MSPTTENHFLFQQELGAVTSLARSCWVASVFSQRSPEKETPNEDATVVIPLDEETAVFAVADGCGGQRGGEIASSLALKCLQIRLLRKRIAPILGLRLWMVSIMPID